MPSGIIINSLSIILGGIAGGLFGDYLREDFKENLNLIFGLASMVMGIRDRKSTRLNSSHSGESRMPSSA